MKSKIKEVKEKRIKKPSRTQAEIEEEQKRTLYIRFPRRIKSVKEIQDLFLGDCKIKLPRKIERWCHAIFPTIDDKIKNLKEVKEKSIDGKSVFVAPPKPIILEKKLTKPKRKKIKLPAPVEEPKINTNKILFVTKIKPGTKLAEIKAAFPGATSAVFLKGAPNKPREAKVKISCPELCLQIVKSKSEWPVINDVRVNVSLSKNKPKKRKPKSKKSKSLKIYNGEEDYETPKIKKEMAQKSEEESEKESEEESLDESNDNESESESEAEEELEQNE